MQIQLTVNNTVHRLDVPDSALLVEVLRGQLGLTGTHIGCDTSQCGACVVHVDGRSVKSCTMLAAQADGQEVITIEGLAAGEALHPMQDAFRNCHGLQCGFCTPGMIMSAVELVQRSPGLTEAEVRKGLEGNICRCTGYQNIVKAVLEGASGMNAPAAS
ncbi:MAG: (2Fe-2S)-binding protein [Gammaproteobacteria bacterium]|nr:(2Fe-2S)-binding protein [Gammaproteobacteria bacterium]MCY4278917.1 (2Fe-2S)-binding protein [Gammaproteobacteria bacterium]